MPQDEIEIELQSSQPASDGTFDVSLRITAYLTGSDYIDANTLTFRCDPIGSNVESSYLQVTFDEWEKVVEIKEFIEDYFSNGAIDRGVLTIDVEDGMASMTSYNEPPHETEDLEEITIEIDDEMIQFYRPGTLYPYIFSYEKSDSPRVPNQPNVRRLCEFFEKSISIHPEFNSLPESPDEVSLIDEARVEALLSEMPHQESDLLQDYQKAVREFRDGEYGDSVRDVGRAVETLTLVLCMDVYDSDDIPDLTARQLAKLDKTSDGLPSFIGKSISPAWWLRNKVSHSNSYQASRSDSLYALLCFQMATEKIGEHLPSQSDK